MSSFFYIYIQNSNYPRRSRGASHVFAASDRPTIIFSSSRKLLYSNLNENEVRQQAGARAGGKGGRAGRAGGRAGGAVLSIGSLATAEECARTQQPKRHH